MGRSELLEQISVSRWQPFRQVSTAAYYCPARQFIHLCQSDSAALDAALTGTDSEAEVAVLPFLFHEARHWFDHVGTLWGLENLVSFFNAVHARRLNDPNQFSPMIDFDRLSRRERFASYYSTIEASSPAPGIPTKWMYQLSCGMRFDVDGHLDDTAPIFFTRFAWADGKMACRVPFSIAALLEAGAMYFEFVANQLAIPKLPSSKQPIEQQAFASRTIDELYTPELGLYSNGVHLISNVLGLSSAAEAFPYAGCLASLCLNLPSRYFESLVIPSKFAQWGDRNAAAITRRERGFAFLVLTHHGANCERNSPIEWVESAAKASGLPGLSELQEAISEEYDSLVQRCSNGPYRPQFDNLVSAGRNFIQAMGVIPTAESVLQDFLSLPLPPIVCSDNQVRQVGSSRLFADDYEFDSWIEEIEQVTAQMHEFVDACGV